MAYLATFIEGLTAESIIHFISKNAGSAAIGWLTRQTMDNMFINDTKKKLESIHKEFEEIKEILKGITLEIEWEHLNSRIFQADIDICHKFQLLFSILSIEDNDLRKTESVRLKEAILDTNGGVLRNLFVIHHVLVGYSETNTTKGLLEMWSEGVYKSITKNLMSAKKYQDNVMLFFTKAAILQFKGCILFSEANKNNLFVKQQLSLIATNLKSQLDLMKKILPDMKDLTDPDDTHAFILQRGSPYPLCVCRSGFDLTLGFNRQNIQWWFFEKSPTFKEDGSLLISASSNRTSDKKYYMSVSSRNTAECVASEEEATSFFVMPLFPKGSQKIMIFKSEIGPQRFLDHKLQFRDRHGDIVFDKALSLPGPVNFCSLM